MRRILGAITSRFKGLFQKGRLDRDLDEELRYHLDKAIEQNIHRGMTPTEARQQAMAAFGGIDLHKEECRDARGLRLVDEFWQDLRYAVRQLSNNPGFAAGAVLTITIGVGVNSGIFTLFDLFFRPLPSKDPHALVQIDLGHRAFKMEQLASFPEYVYLKDHSKTFSGLAAIRNDRLVLGGEAGLVEPRQVHAQYISDTFFSVLAATPTLGWVPALRDAGDGQAADRSAIVILSDRAWQGWFGYDPNILGKPVRVNGLPFVVAGVMPANFVGFGLEEQDGERPGAFAPNPDPDLWLPLTMYPQVRRVDQGIFVDPGDRWLTLHGRLGPGQNPESAAAEITGLLSQVDRDHPESVRGLHREAWAGDPNSKPYLAEPSSVRVVRLSILGEFPADAWPVSLLVLGAAGIVLLIACSNLAHLFLARAAARRREIGMRLCLGAGRGRLIRQLLTETLVLAGLGGVVGLFLSEWTLRALLAAGAISLPGLPDLNRVALANLAPDFRVLGYTLLLSFVTLVAAGVGPAIRATRGDVMDTLKKEGSMFARRRQGLRLRGGLLVIQVALSVVLLISAGLLLRGLARGRELAANAGFDTKSLLVVNFASGSSGYDEAHQRQFKDELTARLSAAPEVRAVTAAYNVPLAGTNHIRTGIALAGVSEDHEFARYNPVKPDYFETVGIPILRGRSFTPEESRRGAPVVVVSESLARRLWPGQDPVGRGLLVGMYASDANKSGLAQVVGVVGDARDRLSGLDDGVFLYAPLADDVQGAVILVRTIASATVMEPAIEATAKSVDANVLVTVNTLTERLSRMDDVLYARSAWQLGCVLGVLALLLATLGLYGATAYSVSRRTHEIGIRMACGATRSDVLRTIIGDGLLVVTVGIGLGIGVAAATSRLLSNLLFGVSSLDVVTYASVPFLLVGATALALFLGALRGTKVDPMVAIRCE